MLEKIRESRFWKAAADIHLLFWLGDVAVALIGSIAAHAHGLPLESVLLYGFGILAVVSATIVFAQYIWKNFQRHRAKPNSLLISATERREVPQERDPQIYVHVEERRNESPSNTVFVLQNHGGSVARKVQIEPLTLAAGEAVFERVDHIGVKQRVQVIPSIDRLGILQKHHIGHLLTKEWDAAGVATDEFVRPMKVVYENYAGRKFETTFDLVFHGVRYTIRDNHTQAWPGHQRPIFEVRDTCIRPLP